MASPRPPPATAWRWPHPCAVDARSQSARIDRPPVAPHGDPRAQSCCERSARCGRPWAPGLCLHHQPLRDGRHGAHRRLGGQGDEARSAERRSSTRRQHADSGSALSGSGRHGSTSEARPVSCNAISIISRALIPLRECGNIRACFPSDAITRQYGATSASSALRLDAQPDVRGNRAAGPPPGTARRTARASPGRRPAAAAARPWQSTLRQPPDSQPR